MLGTPALFATAYGNVGSSIYYALGLVAGIALGLTPVTESKSPQTVAVDETKIAAKIGHYKQYAGKDGKTYVRGFDRAGRAYDLSIDTNGHVQGRVGNMDITFDVRDAA